MKNKIETDSDKKNELQKKYEIREKAHNESKTMLVVVLGICVFLGILYTNNHKKRNQLEEVKKLAYHSVQIENVNDGIYSGEISTSFIYFSLDAEVEGGKLKKIDFKDMKGKGINQLEKIAEKMVSTNSTKVEIERGKELTTLVLMSCLDSAFYDSGNLKNDEKN